jgi:hypothetical protein
MPHGGATLALNCYLASLNLPELHMSNELTFPPAFEEHLNKTLESYMSPKEVKEAIQFCYSLGVEEIKLNTYGNGDEGGGTDIEVKLSKLYIKIPSEVRDPLEEYGSMLAESLNPGYEINEGGGCRCTISFSPFNVRAETYVNEIVETIQDTLTVV